MQEEKPKTYAFFQTVKYSRAGGAREASDKVTVEEPLEIKIFSESMEESTVSIIMRTPSLDNYLAAGFLYSEGIVKSREQIVSMENIDEDGVAIGNIIRVHVSPDVDFGKSGYTRNFAVNSSCGVCGKSNINDIFIKSGRLVRSRTWISGSDLLKLPDRMRDYQKTFGQTGGIHAAGLFTTDGKEIIIAEDIGRHNAVDKVVGYMFLNEMIFREDLVLQVSGRAGFEILQKAAMAGIPIVSSVSAPSTLAVETALSMNMTLACFVREGRFNIYSHAERIRIDG